MSYQTVTNEAGDIYVVLVVASKVIRIVRKCEDRTDAARLLHDLAGWRF